MSFSSSTSTTGGNYSYITTWASSMTSNIYSGPEIISEYAVAQPAEPMPNGSISVSIKKQYHDPEKEWKVENKQWVLDHPNLMVAIHKLGKNILFYSDDIVEFEIKMENLMTEFGKENIWMIITGFGEEFLIDF